MWMNVSDRSKMESFHGYCRLLEDDMEEMQNPTKWEVELEVNNITGQLEITEGYVNIIKLL